ncbi:MAG: hypothetical protein ACRDRL_17470 [Sciscionella sp.]
MKSSALPSGQKSAIEVAELLVALTTREQQARNAGDTGATRAWSAAQDLVRELAGWPREADSDRT